jgi:hypothetical protein
VRPQIARLLDLALELDRVTATDGDLAPVWNAVANQAPDVLTGIANALLDAKGRAMFDMDSTQLAAELKAAAMESTAK